MAITMTVARLSGYVPRKVAAEIKRHNGQQRKANRKEKATEKEAKNMSAKWQSAGVPRDIRRPWKVFHEDLLYTIEDGTELPSEALLQYKEDLHAVQKLGALQAFQALPACRQKAYTEVSLLEVSAFAAWSATCGLADAMERVAAWNCLDAELKADHVCHNWRALLAKNPTWQALIGDAMSEEVEEHHSADKENAADKKTNTLLTPDDDDPPLVVGACAAGAIVQRRGHVFIDTGTRGSDQKSTPGAVDGDKKLHKPARRRQANPACKQPASGVKPAASTSARGRRRGQRQLEALNSKYPWGQDMCGLPPANEEERQSLARQMARLHREKENFARPERDDGERLARAEAMLHIMRGKARVGFGGGRAMATHGLT